MGHLARETAELIDVLPESDQGLIYELVKKLVLAWDPDYTKLTPRERLELEEADRQIARGETVSHDAIDWD